MTNLLGKRVLKLEDWWRLETNA